MNQIKSIRWTKWPNDVRFCFLFFLLALPGAFSSLDCAVFRPTPRFAVIQNPHACFFVVLPRSLHFRKGFCAFSFVSLGISSTINAHMSIKKNSSDTPHMLPHHLQNTCKATHHKHCLQKPRPSPPPPPSSSRPAPPPAPPFPPPRPATAARRPLPPRPPTRA